MENLQCTGAYKDRGAVRAVLASTMPTGGNIDTIFLSTILRRGFAKDGRLAKISVIVPDRPASIVDLAAIATSSTSTTVAPSRRPRFARPRSS
jgi:hypothetical protein